MKNRKLVGMPVACCCLIAAATSFTQGCGRAPAPGPHGLPEVAIITLSTERTVLSTELPGRTSAFLVAEIRPQVNGIIQKRLFEEGSDVRAGDILYQIDPAPYQAAYDQAKAAYAQAEANLPATRARAERLQGLVAVHAVGQQDYDDAVAALQAAEASAAVAKAAMESARINLGYTPVTAPISGRIGKSAVTVGALVTGYQPTPLAVIQQLDPIYVDVTQASADLLRLRRKLAGGEMVRDDTLQRKVKLLLEDGTAYPLEGTFQFRDVTVDPTTGSVTLRLVFPNPAHVLLPGMFVRAIVEEGVDERAILALQQGVTRDLKGNPIAWVVGPGDRVEQRALELDRAIGDRWLVTKGLVAGDRLIVDGLQKVRPGDLVKAVAFGAQEDSSRPPGSSSPSSATK